MPPFSNPKQLPPVAAAARGRAQTTGRSVDLLVWHDIVARDKLVWFDTTIAELETQLMRLTDAGAKPITLDALYDWLSGRSAVPPPPGAVVLCFDDNTSGIVEHAAPRLQKRGWPWALSAHTKYVGTITGKPHNDWPALAAAGRMGATIVSQTHTHPPDLRTLNTNALGREMTASREILMQQMGHAPRFITYPSGKWDGRVALAAANAGYSLGLTEDFGHAETSPHLFGIHRWSTHRRWDEALRAIRKSAG